MDRKERGSIKVKLPPGRDGYVNDSTHLEDVEGVLLAVDLRLDRGLVVVRLLPLPLQHALLVRQRVLLLVELLDLAGHLVHPLLRLLQVLLRSTHVDRRETSQDGVPSTAAARRFKCLISLITA